MTEFPELHISFGTIALLDFRRTNVCIRSLSTKNVFVVLIASNPATQKSKIRFLTDLQTRLGDFLSVFRLKRSADFVKRSKYANFEIFYLDFFSVALYSTRLINNLKWIKNTNNHIQVRCSQYNVDCAREELQGVIVL